MALFRSSAGAWCVMMARVNYLSLPTVANDDVSELQALRSSAAKATPQPQKKPATVHTSQCNQNDKSRSTYSVFNANRCTRYKTQISNLQF